MVKKGAKDNYLIFRSTMKRLQSKEHKAAMTRTELSLNYLNLRHNKIKASFKKGPFMVLINLAELDLNQRSKSQMGSFKGLHSLIELDLNNNEISVIQGELFLWSNQFN